MNVEYISSFNAGELSEYINSRSDIDKYRSGCSILENMFVLPQGGVERRSGTKYMGEALTDNTRLIPFNFSDSVSYVLEFSDTKIRVYGDDGYAGIEFDHPYTVAELPTLKVKQIFDIMYITCPTKPVQKLQRTNINPLTFEVIPVDFIYPPFLEENVEKDLLVETQPLPWVGETDYLEYDQVQYNGLFYSAVADFTSTTSFVVGNWTVLSPQNVNHKAEDEVYLSLPTPVPWEATTDYETDFKVQHLGIAYSADADFTSGATFDASNWTVIVYDDGIFTADMVGGDIRMRHQRKESSTADEGVLVYYKQVSKSVTVVKDDFVNIDLYIRGKYVLTRIQTLNTATGAWTTIGTYYRGTHTYNNAGQPMADDTTFRLWFDDKSMQEAVCRYSIGVDSNRRVTGSFGDSDTSIPLDVSFSNWTVTTGGLDWTGIVELEKSTDNGATWTIETVIGDTYGLDYKNFKASSPAKEGGTTLIRIKFTKDTATNPLTYSMVNDSLYSEGLATITEFIDDRTVKVLIDNSFGSAGPTRRWTLGAFSDEYGYPNAIELYEERIAYAGTDSDPATVWMSVVGDYENFQLGTNNDEALKYIPATPEQTQWLLTKESLHQGTAGGIINNYSVNKDAVITPTNIKASEESSFGCSSVQALFANDVSVYIQKLGKKLRELVYNWETEKFDSNDLTIMANHVISGGVVEMSLQKTPDQIIWCLTADGKMSGLTYERNEEIAGWHRHDFGGFVKSMAIRSGDGEDELWIAVERDGGTYIERTETREFSDDLLDSWYVDSGIKTKLEDNQNVGSWSIDSDLATGHISITTNDHNLSTGDIIRLNNVTGTAASFLNQKEFKIAKIDDNVFKLKSIDDVYINSVKFEFDWLTAEVAIGPTPVPTPVQVRRYNYAGIKNNGIYYQSIDFPDCAVEANAGNQWAFTTDGSGGIFSTITSTTRPPLSGWRDPYTFDTVNPEIVLHNDITLSGGDFTQVSKTWTDLDHLDGETVQIQGDGGFAGTATVVSGQVTTDEYYNQTIMGLQFVSVLQPMYIEAGGGHYNPIGRRKNMAQVAVKFLRTVGALVGTKNLGGNSKVDTQVFKDDHVDDINYKTEQVIFRTTTDALGRPIAPYTGDKLIYLNDNWERLKALYVVQNLPMPMTVLGMSVFIKVGEES